MAMISITGHVYKHRHDQEHVLTTYAITSHSTQFLDHYVGLNYTGTKGEQSYSINAEAI